MRGLRGNAAQMWLILARLALFRVHTNIIFVKLCKYLDSCVFFSEK